MKTQIVRETTVRTSGRVLQMSALFDLPPTEKARLEWDVELPIEDREWSVGLIVGPSGCGKSTIAHEMFAADLVSGFDWPSDRGIIDCFPTSIPTKEVVELLSSVGFNSPPAWLRPFQVLSNGEQFRVTCARAMAESSSQTIVIDEFTSVVDRQVAKIASHAIQKTVRRSGRRLVAVSCHFDIIDWLQPDWTYEPATGKFQWRELQRHPQLTFELRPCDKNLWRTFKHHHYLSADIHPGAKCYAAYLDGQPVAFAAVLHFLHPKTRNIKMGHRLVVLPDFQGLGLGGRIDDALGQYLHELGFRYRNCVAHPAMIAFYSRSPRWRRTQAATNDLDKLFSAVKLQSSPSAVGRILKKQAQTRRLNVVSFEYVPPVKCSKPS